MSAAPIVLSRTGSRLTPLDLARAGLDSCVHCGFCLQACPTYLALEDENDSPRGRLVLMRAAVEGTIALDDPDVATHLSRCLGCRGCESSCPSGVPYGHLLEKARETLAALRPLPLQARLILWVFGKPAKELTGFAQVHIDGTGGDTFAVRVAPGVKTELWGDAAGLPVAQL